ALQRAQDTSPPTTLLTRVTRIFQKSVFTETTPAARTGHRAGFFAARTHIAAAVRRQRTRHARIAIQSAGCRNEEPLFPDCYLQCRSLVTRFEGQSGR